MRDVFVGEFIGFIVFFIVRYIFMEVQKILISFKSGVITPIESDTLLSYIIALDFPNTETIFQKFLKPQTVPFIFSNAMLAGELPRPL